MLLTNTSRLSEGNRLNMPPRTRMFGAVDQALSASEMTETQQAADLKLTTASVGMVAEVTSGVTSGFSDVTVSQPVLSVTVGANQTLVSSAGFSTGVSGSSYSSKAVTQDFKASGRILDGVANGAAAEGNAGIDSANVVLDADLSSEIGSVSVSAGTSGGNVFDG